MDLLEAVATGATARVAALLKTGADPDSRNYRSETALCVAAEKRHVDIAKLLLTAGATVDLELQNEATALMVSAIYGPVELVCLLLKHGANVHHSITDGTALLLAARANNEEIVDVLLTHGANVHDTDVLVEKTPLLVAADHGNVLMATRLLAAGATISDVDKRGFGVVYYAALRDRADMITFLVRNDADPNATSHSGSTPLYGASGCGHIHAMRALLDAGAHLQPVGAVPSLHAAVMYGQSEAVAWLLDAGADVNAMHPHKRATALHVAAAKGHADIVRQLAYARAKLDEPAYNGQTALMIARDHGHGQVVAVLQDVRTKKMHLLHAARQGDVATVQSLLSEGLSANETDDHGNSLILLALLGRHEKLLAALLANAAFEHHHVNKWGESPAAIAIKLGVPSLIKTLHAAQTDTTVHVTQTHSTTHLRELGRGSYGIVFKDSLFGQDVAVKVLLNASRKAAECLRYEIQVLKNNPSPYIVRLIATAEAESDAPQLFFEYMDGGNLTSYLEKIAADEPVPVVYAPIEILWVVANALRDLHANNIVHRDIKPDNILLSSKYYIKLGDVGIAKEESTNMTTGAGTSKWRAPEVLTCGSSYGTPADIYSFGVLLQTLRPGHARSDTAPWLLPLAARCTAVDPTLRPTAAEIVDILRPKLQSQIHLVASMHIFEMDRAAGLQTIATLEVPPCPEPATTSTAPVLATKHRDAEAARSLDEAYYRAVDAGDVDAVRALLENGVDPDHPHEVFETALAHAVELGHCAVVDTLLAYGANVNFRYTMGGTALHLAAANCSNEVLEALLRVRNVDVNPQNIMRRTPLHFAVVNKQTANVIALLRAGADVDVVDEDKHRPLHEAVGLGHDAITAVLLKYGAATDPLNESGDTVLYTAILLEHGPIATRLVRAGASVNAVSNEQSPLHCACERGVADVIPALLAHGADINAKYKGVSSLWMAILKGHSSVVDALLASHEIDLHERHENGFTLLHNATCKGHLDIVKTLLEAGVDIDEKTATLGWNPIDLAVRRGNHSMVELLRPAYVHKQALLRTVRSGDIDGLAALLQRPYSCNVYDEVGCSLIHLAVAAHNKPMLDLLLTKPRVRLETRNNENKTPLAMAIERGYTCMSKTLFHRASKTVDKITCKDFVVTTTELGVGSFGVVLLGSYRGCNIAVKKLKNAQQIKSFLAEVYALTKCPSPYLVRLVAVADLTTDTPALLLEYMDGGNLRNHLDSKRRNQYLSVHVTNRDIAWVVINALRDLHAKNLMHRDVKSANVLLRTTGEIKLGDLGLARIVATEMTEAPGTRLWMAPEILRANGTSYGLPADIYAFGVLLTELATCQLPYFDQDVQDPNAFVDGVINGSLRPSLPPDCEPWLRTLANMCLRGDPAARPTADQIVDLMCGEMAAAATSASASTYSLPPTLLTALAAAYLRAVEAYLRAVAHDDVETVATLLRQSLSLNATLPGGASLLLAATSGRATAIVTWLLDHGADVNDMRGGRTPLHEAAAKGAEPILSMLIDAGADVDARDQNGKTPLAYAVHATSNPCILPLIATGADVRIAALDGTSPLEVVRTFHATSSLASTFELAASREASAPDILCVRCGNWHPVEATCATCRLDVSTMDRKVAVLRRLLRLHHRGYPVNWTRKCGACHQTTTMTIVDVICPKCAHYQQPGAIKLKVFATRLKMALQSTTPRHAANDVAPKPGGIRHWHRHAADVVWSEAPESLVSHDHESSHAQGNVMHREEHPEAALDTTDEMAPYARASSFCRGDVARMMYARMANCVPEVLASKLPEPDRPFKLEGIALVHRHVGDDVDLDAVVRCTSPFVVAICGAAPPKSILVVLETSLRELLYVPVVRTSIKRHGPRVKLQYAYIVANALRDIHAHGLVHGYLSSHNVFFSPTEYFQVGVPGTSATNESLLAWTAPEVLTGDSTPSSASDIYAFGILLTELDTLDLPFHDEEAPDLKEAVVNRGRRPVLSDDCQAWYRKLVRRCLEPDPRNRPTATDLVDELQEIVDDNV